MRNQLAQSTNALTEEYREIIHISSSLSRQKFVRRFRDSLRREEILLYLTSPENQTNGWPSLKETVPFKDSGVCPEVLLKEIDRVEDRFFSLQKWEGVVLEVKEDYFIARLHDLTVRGNEEEVELPLEEVSEGDRDLVKPGAVFYWHIGYFDSRTGQRKRESVTRFRRLPAWRQEELESAKSEVDKIRDSIGWK